MRLHLLEHDPTDLSSTNMTKWARAKGHPIQHTYVCNNEKLPAMDDFDWLMIMGGSPHAWEEDKHPWLAPEKTFIANALDRHKIIFGVCFGAQLIAEALGGQVFQNDQTEIGWYEIALTDEGKGSFLFQNIPERFITFHWHADYFSLPQGCSRLAFSQPTPIQAFVVEDRPIVGVQFHPEYTKSMVEYFANEVGHEWERDTFVAGRDAVLAQTPKIPDTYWLMESMMENMEHEYERTR